MIWLRRGAGGKPVRPATNRFAICTSGPGQPCGNCPPDYPPLLAYLIQGHNIDLCDCLVQAGTPTISGGFELLRGNPNNPILMYQQGEGNACTYLSDTVCVIRVTLHESDDCTGAPYSGPTDVPLHWYFVFQSPNRYYAALLGEAQDAMGNYIYLWAFSAYGDTIGCVSVNGTFNDLTECYWSVLGSVIAYIGYNGEVWINTPPG